jgi:hypothetical protein
MFNRIYVMFTAIWSSSVQCSATVYILIRERTCQRTEDFHKHELRAYVEDVFLDSIRATVALPWLTVDSLSSTHPLEFLPPTNYHYSWNMSPLQQLCQYNQNIEQLGGIWSIYCCVISQRQESIEEVSRQFTAA